MISGCHRYNPPASAAYCPSDKPYNRHPAPDQNQKYSVKRHYAVAYRSLCLAGFPESFRLYRNFLYTTAYNCRSKIHPPGSCHPGDIRTLHGDDEPTLFPGSLPHSGYHVLALVTYGANTNRSSSSSCHRLFHTSHPLLAWELYSGSSHSHSRR